MPTSTISVMTRCCRCFRGSRDGKIFNHSTTLACGISARRGFIREKVFSQRTAMALECAHAATPKAKSTTVEASSNARIQRLSTPYRHATYWVVQSHQNTHKCTNAGARNRIRRYLNVPCGCQRASVGGAFRAWLAASAWYNKLARLPPLAQSTPSSEHIWRTLYSAKKTFSCSREIQTRNTPVSRTRAIPLTRPRSLMSISTPGIGRVVQMARAANCFMYSARTARSRSASPPATSGGGE